LPIIANQKLILGKTMRYKWLLVVQLDFLLFVEEIDKFSFLMYYSTLCKCLVWFSILSLFRRDFVCSRDVLT
jgi:hypothetical protein